MRFTAHSKYDTRARRANVRLLSVNGIYAPVGHNNCEIVDRLANKTAHRKIRWYRQQSRPIYLYWQLQRVVQEEQLVCCCVFVRATSVEWNDILDTRPWYIKPKLHLLDLLSVYCARGSIQQIQSTPTRNPVNGVWAKAASRCRVSVILTLWHT